MEAEVFRFKEFDIRHGQSSMKVGVDAVLLGAWVSSSGHRVLDVGTGCGIIALMYAQRFRDAEIVAIDLDKKSIEEAELNFQNSPWNERLTEVLGSFPEIMAEIGEKFDLILSNPPFFDSGISNPKTPREKARHQDSLSVFSLIRESCKYLNPGGSLAMIYPSEFHNEVKETGKESGFIMSRTCEIRNREGKKAKRRMSELILHPAADIKPFEERLILFEDGQPTLSYKNLCKDFYLKF